MNYASLAPALTLLLITVVTLIHTAPLLGAHRRLKRTACVDVADRCSASEVTRETRNWHEAEEGVRVQKAGYSFPGGILLSSG